MILPFPLLTYTSLAHYSCYACCFEPLENNPVQNIVMPEACNMIDDVLSLSALIRVSCEEIVKNVLTVQISQQFALGFRNSKYSETYQQRILYCHLILSVGKRCPLFRVSCLQVWLCAIFLSLLKHCSVRIN